MTQVNPDCATGKSPESVTTVVVVVEAVVVVGVVVVVVDVVSVDVVVSSSASGLAIVPKPVRTTNRYVKYSFKSV